MRCSVRYAAAIAVALALRAGDAAAHEESAWSTESNGLQARLVLRRSHVSNGTAIIATYVEFRNVSPVISPVRFTWERTHVRYRVTDEQGREVPMAAGDGNGPIPELGELVLPHDGTLRFRVGPWGSGVPADKAALVDLGPGVGWVLPRDGKRYDLRAVLEIEESKEMRRKRDRTWHGRLELPPVRIPTEPEPLDPEIVAARIAELGPKMLGLGGLESDAAMRALSLIDDPRVVPWYVQAVETDRYSLKFQALDRLCRLDGDAALEGLKIGMVTQGKDLGHCSTPAVADQLAVNIRHKAANALARSTHPKSDSLLLSMEDDPAPAVRLAVVQAAARMRTPESLALLERRARDEDSTVRGEAARLIKVRSGELTTEPGD